MAAAELVHPPYPMLAKTGKLEEVADFIKHGYVCENKIDGVRCIAVVGDMGGVQLYNRQLRNMTAAFPDVVEQLKAHTSTGVRLLGPLVLDGEIYVRGSDGEPDFQLVQHRANRLRDVDVAAATYSAKYAVFDVLSSGHIDYKPCALCDRRRILEEVAAPLMVPTYTQEEANDRAARSTGEGLMLKHSSSKYVPGARSVSWRKIKYEHEVECYVGGVTYGYGKRANTFGSLLVGVYKPGDAHGLARLTYIGSVGTGFSDVALETIMQTLRPLRTPTCPFDVDAVIREGGWDTAFYTPAVLRIKVRFANYTRDGIMRHPRFVGLVN